MGYYRAGDYYAAGDPFGGGLVKWMPGAGTMVRAGKKVLGAARRAGTGPLASLRAMKELVSGRGRRGRGRRMIGRMGRYRRMNVCNPRALRRALRRAKGFEHFARQVVRITSPKRHVAGFYFRRRRKRK